MKKYKTNYLKCGEKSGHKITFARIIIIVVSIILIGIISMFSGCSVEDGINTRQDIANTRTTVNDLVNHQPTPTDLDYSLERYNLIRRAYWVNGQREKAINLPCGIIKPLGYVVLFSNSGAVIGRFIVDGKVSSLNSFLTPNIIQEGTNSGYAIETELPDIDGSYGENVNGIFFFTTDGKYIEWTGDFLYSDIPFTVDDPILRTE